MKTASDRYDAVAIFFHWAIAALITAALIIVWVSPSHRDPSYDYVMAFHKSAGILVLVLALARLIWRWRHPVAPAAGREPWEAWLSKLNHGLLYVIIIAIPLSGYLFTSALGDSLDFFNLAALPSPMAEHKAFADAAETFHVLGQWAVYAFVGIHVAGALYHYLIKRDRVLQRMLRAPPE
jgi:cytochrome b561